jgi:hypothetical protein
MGWPSEFERWLPREGLTGIISEFQFTAGDLRKQQSLTTCLPVARIATDKQQVFANLFV